MSDELPSVPAPPDIGSADATSAWRALLHQRLANQPSPVVIVSDTVRSAASLWTGLRAWVSTFRAEGICAGDRVISALPAGDALLQLTLACLWESVGLVVGQQLADEPEPITTIDALLDRYGARCVVHATRGGRHVLRPAPGGWPGTPIVPRAVPATAGSNHQPGLATASGAEVWSYAACLRRVRQAHVRGGLASARVLSLCRWHDRTGLWDGVMVPLLEADELYLPHADLSPDAIRELLTNEPITQAIVDDATSASVHNVLDELGVPVRALVRDHA